MPHWMKDSGNWLWLCSRLGGRVAQQAPVKGINWCDLGVPWSDMQHDIIHVYNIVYLVFFFFYFPPPTFSLACVWWGSVCMCSGCTQGTFCVSEQVAWCFVTTRVPVKRSVPPYFPFFPLFPLLPPLFHLLVFGNVACVCALRVQNACSTHQKQQLSSIWLSIPVSCCFAVLTCQFQLPPFAFITFSRLPLSKTCLDDELAFVWNETSAFVVTINCLQSPFATHRITSR